MPEISGEKVPPHLFLQHFRPKPTDPSSLSPSRSPAFHSLNASLEGQLGERVSWLDAPKWGQGETEQQTVGDLQLYSSQILWFKLI